MARSLKRSRERDLRRERRRRELRAGRVTAATAAVLGASVVFAPSAFGDTFTVTSSADPGDGNCDATCTLREAVDAANANADPEVDIVNFSGVAGEITLTNGQIDITDEVTINGPGASTLTVSGDANTNNIADPFVDSRVFAALGAYATPLGEVTISGLTIAEGVAAYDTYYDPLAMETYYYANEGGGIFAYYADLNLTGTVVSGNTALGGGGGVYSYGGELNVGISSEISDNLAFQDGGGIGTLFSDGGTIEDSEVSGNVVLGNDNYDTFGYSIGAGGGISLVADGGTTLDNATVTGNDAYDDGIGPPYVIGVGGGVFANGGEVNVLDSYIAGNSAYSQGGGALLVSGDVNVTGSLVAYNDTGGGDFPAAGGLLIAPGSQATVTESTVYANYTGGTGGGLLTGGGGDVTVEESTISGNDAAGDGGGVLVAPGDGDAFTLRNSTVSGNTANGGTGGGLELYSYTYRYYGNNYESGPIAIRNSTVASNSDDEAGIYDDAYADPSNPNPIQPVQINSSIVADNVDTADIDHSGDSAGFTAGRSLIEDSNAPTLVSNPAGSNILGSDPQLGPLAGNGGPTETHLPALTSPAIDKGIANGLTTDQRGQPRTFDTTPANAADGTDMGSVEITGPPAPPPPGGGTLGRCAGRAVTGTTGTPGPDVLRGTKGPNVIRGRGGRDIICGLGGRDKLIGGGGNDKLLGGRGGDRLLGGRGRDRLLGGPGRDRLLGGPGRDFLLGGGGRDILRGGPGRDRQRQ